jgi:S1-C subfamily serine protease
MIHKSNISTSRGLTAVACGLALSVASALCSADELAEKGRDVFKKYRHSVVTVQIVVKTKFSMGGMGGQANESRQDVTGTIIDPSGLTVLSLAATDPGQMVQSVMSGMSDDDSKFKFETELSDVKILLEDGTEVASEVVLRDKDLDLAFVRPKGKLTAQLSPLDLSKSGKVDILDQVIALNRLGNAAGRAYAASVERISAVVERPRLFYVPETSFTTTTLGAPAFTLDGKVVGLFVMRTLKGRSGAGMGMMNMQPQNIAGIIVPADDIQKVAKQVPAASEEKPKDQK